MCNLLVPMLGPFTSFCLHSSCVLEGRVAWISRWDLSWELGIRKHKCSQLWRTRARKLLFTNIVCAHDGDDGKNSSSDSSPFYFSRINCTSNTLRHVAPWDGVHNLHIKMLTSASQQKGQGADRAKAPPPSRPGFRPILSYCTLSCRRPHVPLNPGPKSPLFCLPLLLIIAPIIRPIGMTKA